MSTDIVSWHETGDHSFKKVFQLEALQIYLAISLPLIAITLFLSYAFYKWETRAWKAKSDSDCEKD